MSIANSVIIDREISFGPQDDAEIFGVKKKASYVEKGLSIIRVKKYLREQRALFDIAINIMTEPELDDSKRLDFVKRIVNIPSNIEKGDFNNG